MGNQQTGAGGLVGQFLPQLSTLVVKVWRVPHPYCTPPAAAEAEAEEAELEQVEGGDEVVIVLRHHRRSGHKALFIDGKEVHRAQNAVDAGEIVAFEVPVRIGPGGRVKHLPAELKVVDFPGLSSYELQISGRPIASDIEILDDDDRNASNTKRWTWGHVHVPSVTLQPVPHQQGAGGMEVAAFYTVEATRVVGHHRNHRGEGSASASASGEAERRERRRVVQRRFGEFDALDAAIRGYFHGHHLASSLPTLPPKHLKALTPHTDPAFLETRRQGLEGYLARLCRFPHLDRHPDLLAFLGFEVGEGPAVTGSGAAAAGAAGREGDGGGAAGRGGEGHGQRPVVVDL